MVPIVVWDIMIRLTRLFIAFVMAIAEITVGVRIVLTLLVAIVVVVITLVVMSSTGVVVITLKESISTVVVELIMTVVVVVVIVVATLILSRVDITAIVTSIPAVTIIRVVALVVGFVLRLNIRSILQKFVFHFVYVKMDIVPLNMLVVVQVFE